MAFTWHLYFKKHVNALELHFCTLIFVFTNWVKMIVWGNAQIELNLNIPVRMYATMFLSVFSVHSTVMESFDAILKEFPHYIHIILQCSIRPGNIWLIVIFTMITWCIFQFMNSHNRGALLTCWYVPSECQIVSDLCAFLSQTDAWR